MSFLQSAAVKRLRAELGRQFAHIRDFGRVAGDGVTDDAGPLLAFFASAIANPGVPHALEAKSYATAQRMPTINRSNVLIRCPGMAEVHDVGALFSGAVLRYIGAASALPMIDIGPTEGAAAQRLSGIIIDGLGLDCNGLLGIGAEVRSANNGVLSLATANATAIGVHLKVSATLGEGTSIQRNVIKLQARQIEAAGGVGLVCSGSAIGNVSMNEIFVDHVHKDGPAVILENTDNNDFRFLRAYCVPGGTATDSVSVLGGTAEPVSARSDRFHFVSTNKPMQFYGTGSHAYPATNHRLWALDKSNGTPDPVVGVDASVYWLKDTTPHGDTAWRDFVPVLSVGSGALGEASASAKYLDRGKVRHVRFQIVITNNGTAGGSLSFTLPGPSAGAVGAAFFARERAVTGRTVSGFVDGAGASVVTLQNYDGTYPGGTGYVITGEGFYEVA